MSTELEPHPISLELPDMDPKEFQELKEDIDKKGLKERIITYAGMILDGRHRAKACVELGIPLDYETNLEEFNEEADGDPRKYVISRNIMRRHLTAKDPFFKRANWHFQCSRISKHNMIEFLTPSRTILLRV